MNKLKGWNMNKTYIVPNLNAVCLGSNFLDKFPVEQTILAPGELCYVYTKAHNVSVINRESGHLIKETYNTLKTQVPEIMIESNSVYKLCHKLQYICGLYKVKRIFWRILPNAIPLTDGTVYHYCMAGFLIDDGEPFGRYNYGTI